MQALNARIEAFWTTRFALDDEAERAVFEMVSGALGQPIEAVTFEAWAGPEDRCFRLLTVETPDGAKLTENTHKLPAKVVAHLVDEPDLDDPHEDWETLVDNTGVWKLFRERACRVSDEHGNFRLSTGDLAHSATRLPDPAADLTVGFGPDDALVITVTSNRDVRLWRRSETILHDTARPSQGHVDA